jgi:ABC-type lipoprotein release transport system permease subunit
MEIIKIAWRNVWRSKTRSLVVIAAVCIGMIGGVFSSALMFGMMEQRIKVAISTEMAHIQIHNPKYIDNQESKYFIDNTNEYLTKIRKIEGVNAAARLKVSAMASSAETATGVVINGIIPTDEIKVSDISTRLVAGDYFAEDKSNQILVGSEFAKKLKLDLRSKVILNFQDTSGTLTGGTFRVCGIFKTSNKAYDETQVFVRKGDLAQLCLYDENVSQEIAILINDNEKLDEVKTEISGIVGKNLLVRTWKEISPDLAMLTDMMTQYGAYLVFIILMALAFGIINTMLMAILERKKELGMLMAIGMNKPKIRRMIVWETIFLTFIGTIIGIVISQLLVGYFGRVGINLGIYADAFESMGYDSMLYPVLNTGFYIQVVSLTIFTALFSAIFPIRRAIKMNPAEVLRTE